MVYWRNQPAPDFVLLGRAGSDMGTDPTIATLTSAWLRLARLPFHSVGVLPYVLGNVVAWKTAGSFRWSIFGWGTMGVILVMLATYFAGEYWDEAEDTISGEAGRSRFAGGSGVTQAGLVSRRAVQVASLACAVLALAVGAVLVLFYQVGVLALAFGCVGLIGGFFYSARPVRWVSTGVGELWIAFCYGWLPVAVGVYLQTNQIAPVVHWMSVPIGLTIFNVILLNEFPDYAADRETGKRNLTVRLGRERAGTIYTSVSAASWGAMLLSIGLGARIPPLALWVYLPVLALSVAATVFVFRRRWRDRDSLERLCGATIVVNLGTTLSFVLAFAFGA
jgi:1,4-dihydroxy-2-naphthoate octaprenyltransferase